MWEKEAREMRQELSKAVVALKDDVLTTIDEVPNLGTLKAIIKVKFQMLEVETNRQVNEFIWNNSYLKR